MTDHIAYVLAVVRTWRSRDSEDVVPAHLTNTNLNHTLATARNLKLPRMEAEARALLRLRPEQRKAGWAILRGSHD